ncbi:PilZ domain-containing protein [Chitinibacter sp. SCUT-21]|uniref:PilZ domain-containing protein n=1 Tax=Chitinibacter sp. SCUT-21 TaxID=2970891 RepID=UPI0035A66EFA
MFNLARILHFATHNTAEAQSKDLPCPDVVRDPRAILDRLTAQAQLAQQGGLMAMLEGDTQAIRVNKMIIHPQGQMISIELMPQEDEIVGQQLTLIGLWHENKLAFSVEILQKLSLNNYLISWPKELLETTGRDYFRVHAQHKEFVSIKVDDHTICAQLYDLSEGGIGVKIENQKSLCLCKQPLQWLEIHLANYSLTLHCRLCNQLVDQTLGTSRLGFAFISLNEPQALIIRKIMLQLQARQPT